MTRAIIHIIYIFQGMKYEKRFILRGSIKNTEQVLSILPKYVDPDDVLYSEWRELTPTCPEYNIEELELAQVNVFRNEEISSMGVWKHRKKRIESEKKDPYKTSRKLIKEAYYVEHF